MFKICCLNVQDLSKEEQLLDIPPILTITMETKEEGNMYIYIWYSKKITSNNTGFLKNFILIRTIKTFKIN